MPSPETLEEMIRSMRDETLPTMRRESSNGLLAIHQKLDGILKTLEEHEKRITMLENYKSMHDGEVRTWKLISGFFLTLAGIIATLFANKIK